MSQQTADFTQTPPANSDGVVLTFDSKVSRAQSTKAKPCKVKPGSNEKPSVCIVYQPGNEPIYMGHTGTLQVADGGGVSQPVRSMNLELWEELTKPIEIQDGVPPIRYSSNYWSLDLWPGATFDVDKELWERFTAEYKHLRDAMDAGWIKVYNTKKGHKGSANCSVAFAQNEAINVVRNTWDEDMLNHWLKAETRDQVEKVIQAQIKVIQGESLQTSMK